MSKQEELLQRRKLKCRHFSGMSHSACDNGIQYDSVRQIHNTNFYRYPCITLTGHEQVSGCDFYEPYTQEELDAEEAKHQRWLDCLKRGVSSCCEAPIDESQVITEGSHKGHGPRFCSKCGKLVYRV